MAASPPKVIVFSHANGFPAGTYRRIFAAWREAGYTVHAIEKYGHDPRYPVTSNWPHLRDQLVDFIAHEAPGGTAFLVGHSLGGYLSLMAASRRPDLAAGLVLLDSPVLGGWRARAVQFAKAAGVGERFSPGHVSKRRRQQWDNAEEAYAHFAAKPGFARWAPGMLRDYLAAGIEPHGAQHRLSFDRDIETAIYNTLPHQLLRQLRLHPLRCDMAFLRGTQSNEARLAGMRATERLAAAHGGGRIVAIEGSHLFPLERPGPTAAAVLAQIATMRAPSPPSLPDAPVAPDQAGLAGRAGRARSL